MSRQTLHATDTQLAAAAVAAARNSYSPYSRFPVGAAVLTDDGQIFSGCNVENASYGLTLCAERVALSAAVAAGHRRIVAIAVVAAANPPAYPCGACLQVMAEFCAPRCRILLAPLDRPRAIRRALLRDLLPKTFTLTPR